MWEILFVLQVQLHLSLTNDPMLHVLSISMGCPGQSWRHHPGTVQKIRWWGSFWCGLVSVVGFGGRLDWMILEVFSSLTVSMVAWLWQHFRLFYSCHVFCLHFFPSLALQTQSWGKAQPKGITLNLLPNKKVKRALQKKDLAALVSFEAATSLQTGMLSI